MTNVRPDSVTMCGLVVAYPKLAARLLVFATAALSFGSSAQARSDITAVPSLDAYRPGAIVAVRPAFGDDLSRVPPETAGGSIYQGGAMSFGDKAPLPADEGPVAMDLKGFLRADATGAYQLFVDLKSHDAIGTVFPTTCFVQAWVGDKMLGPRSITIANPASRDATGSLLLNVDLSPGIYPLRMWLACDLHEDTTATSSLSIRTPDIHGFRPIDGRDILHRQE